MWKIAEGYAIIIVMLTSLLIFGQIVLNRFGLYTLKKNLFLLTAISIIQTIILLNYTGTEKTVLILITNMITLKKIFNISFSKSIFLAIMYMIILVIPDILQILFITKIIGITNFYNNYAGTIMGNIISSIILLLIAYCFRKPLQKIAKTEINNNTKIIVLSIATLIPISLFFYSFVKKFEFSNDIVQYLIAMIVLAAILFSLIKQTLDNNKLTKEYDKLLEFMTTYENEIENQRILRHETKNEFLTIRAKICDKQENEEIVSYIDEILNEKIKVNQEKYAKFGYLPPNGIKGLCYFKVQEAENKGIKVSLNISKRIKTSNIYKLDTKQQKSFGRIIGVILDNAIEASLNSSDKQLGIEAYTNAEKEFKMIISNSYTNEVDSNKIGIERFSTKGKNRGHGLLLVKHIINDNRIFNLKTNIQDDIYTQIITIKNSID